MSRVFPAAVTLAAAALLVAGCGGGGTSDVAAPADTTEASPTGCTAAELPEPRENGGASEPEPLAPGTTATLEFVTNCGSFTVTLDVEQAPEASASLVSLARSGFFDDTIFHRIVPGFVIQGGDPTQSGAGGPGYKTLDVPPKDASYTKGVVAMAKTAAEPPGTAGSQFFVVTGPDIGLPPEYAVVGTVTSGLATVERIGALGDASEQPTEPVVISEVVVSTAP